ncbi:arylsulfatase [Ilumatobacter coccineus]|uniref:Putative arylsulfatase n=1 Tax=Ilumatobacter coccineus (strain NBRC 103263 / KCTC 29153 / YM16-304) TaxID=1313172 RepID=A0A6C7EFX8_ILUCY|nr:arylsulfatase [Ilumatobacter coccineus]BAN04069.1 putative arylsulfatase [Ilumatobacter coccineus YM16-304]
MPNRFRGNIGLTLADSTPWWPEQPDAADKPHNVMIVLLDDVGFADFGCYGSGIRTPTIDRLADEGVRYTGFHTTAMCSTTRASLLTGANHHSVGMGCLANFDSGFPGYRGKISADAPTIAELLRPHGYRNYMVGKWHATSVAETGPTGPFDGWPLGRGFDRFYGFLDAETDQYSPELVRDNSHITAPGTYESGYHLTADLATEAIRYLADHRAAAPQHPWMLMFSPGACHAPHQAPRALIDEYTETFTHGWDIERERRLARQIELGIVPAGTELCDRNDGVRAWDEHSADEHRLFSRLAGAYAAMLDHFDQHLARVIDFLETTGQLDDTIVMVLSDNGASQEGGPLGFVNAMAPFNMVQEPLDQKLARLDDIGGPDTHSNFPHGWAMTSNTPLRRYKQNTHGGGVRDPLVIRTPNAAESGIAGSTRHQFCHVSDLAPTLFDLLELDPPGATMEGTSFAATIADPEAETGKDIQYFEMFGHRGLWHDGWKAVAYHAPGTPFDDDRWELFDLTTDFNETNDLADEHPDRLAEMIEMWWAEAEANQVLPLDDRFGERFAENAERWHGSRRAYVFEAGMGHLPSDVAPDLRSRSYTITAEVDPLAGGEQGVLIAHGDATCGYSLFVQDGHLVHDLNIGGTHQLVRSATPLPTGATSLAFSMTRSPGTGPFPHGVGTLLVDGEPVGSMETDQIFWLMISWSGLDIGLDRGTTVADYDGSGRHIGPFEFTGTLHRVRVDLSDDQELDHDAAGATELARE